MKVVTGTSQETEVTVGTKDEPLGRISSRGDLDQELRGESMDLQDPRIVMLKRKRRTWSDDSTV